MAKKLEKAPALGDVRGSAKEGFRVAIAGGWTRRKFRTRGAADRFSAKFQRWLLGK